MGAAWCTRLASGWHAAACWMGRIYHPEADDHAPGVGGFIIIGIRRMGEEGP